MNYTEDDLRMTVKNVSSSKDGLYFIEILLDKFGAFERGCNFQNQNMEMFNRGKREQGLWLLDLLLQSNFEKYTEVERKRRTICQKMNKTLNQD